MVQHRIGHASGEPQSVSASMPKMILPFLCGDPQATATAQRLWADSGAGVPARHMKDIDESDAPAPWIASRNQVIAAIGSGFMIALLGKRGTGKTQIAVQAVQACAAGIRTCSYVKALDIFLAIRASYKSETLTELEVVEAFVDPRLLVIDECQVRGGSDFEDRMLVHILDKRYDAMVDTILIANLNEPQFREEMGASICDRIRETGHIIPCEWKSFRAK